MPAESYTKILEGTNDLRCDAIEFPIGGVGHISISEAKSHNPRTELFVYR